MAWLVTSEPPKRGCFGWMVCFGWFLWGVGWAVGKVTCVGIVVFFEKKFGSF